MRFRIEPHQSGIELVDAIVAQLRMVSKTKARRLIADGNVKVDHYGAPPDWKLMAGNTVELFVPVAWLASENTTTARLNRDDIIFEDQHLFVVNKPAGVSVLSDRSTGGRSLFDALRAHAQSAADADWYPHVCHRLDKETSGVLVVCKTRDALERLTGQFESREVEKEYLAVVLGAPPHDRGKVDFPIMEHPKEASKMTTVHGQAAGAGAGRAKQATTEFEVVERFARFALLKLRPHTGRTHQVRVHLAAMGYPVAVDKLYGDREPVLLSRIKANYKRKKFEAERPLISRLALHASRLAFDHPIEARRVEVGAPLPADMELLLRALRRFGGSNNMLAGIQFSK